MDTRIGGEIRTRPRKASWELGTSFPTQARRLLKLSSQPYSLHSGAGRRSCRRMAPVHQQVPLLSESLLMLPAQCLFSHGVCPCMLRAGGKYVEQAQGGGFAVTKVAAEHLLLMLVEGYFFYHVRPTEEGRQRIKVTLFFYEIYQPQLKMNLVAVLQPYGHRASPRRHLPIALRLYDASGRRLPPKPQPMQRPGRRRKWHRLMC